MKKTLLIALAIIAFAVGVIIHRKIEDRNVAVRRNVSNSDSHPDGRPAPTSSLRVPAYQKAAEVRTLGETLEPLTYWKDS